MKFTKTNIGNHLNDSDQIDKKAEPITATLHKAKVSCLYECEVLNSSFVHPMKFSDKNPRLRKGAKRMAKLIRM
jgi:hypothetical protein